MAIRNREARNRWDKKNMKVLSCKVRKEIAEEFAEVCRKLGTTPNAVFRETIMSYLRKQYDEEMSEMAEPSVDMER